MNMNMNITVKKTAAAIACVLAMTACSGNTPTENAGSLTSQQTAPDVTVTAEVSENTAENGRETAESSTAQSTASANESDAEPAASTTTTANKSNAEPAETTAASTTPTESSEPSESTTASSTNQPTEDAEMSQEVKYIALTFDDGPNSTTTNEVIDKLEKYGIVASFFLVGDNITDESAKTVKRAYDLGCEINNHSRSHSNMTELSAEDIQAEYKFVDDKVFEITGEHTKFFRPPYIAVHQVMFDNIDVPFIAGISASDWDDRMTAEKRARTILKQAKDGDIILLHDMEGNSATVEALDTIIPELQKQGYKFVTVSELFEAKGITPDMEKVYTNVTQKNMYN